MATHRSKIAKECLYCHKRFFPIASAPGKYCSITCSHTGNTKKRGVPCVTCGVLVIRHACRADRLVVCSKECKKKMLSKTKLANKNPNWAGARVGYSGLHTWVKRRKEKPSACEGCGLHKKLDLANISQEYRRDLADWEWLCRRCHMTKDGRMDRMKKVLPPTEKSCECCHKVFFTKRKSKRFCSLSCVTRFTNLFVRDYNKRKARTRADQGGR